MAGLRNTRFFDPYLEQELEAARRDEQPLSVIMIDLDHFKKFNDTYGHPAGDEALRTFARVVGGSIRASDVSARSGGEEFIVALRHSGMDEARAVAEKLRSSIEQMVVELGPGRHARITASFGIATSGPHLRDPKALVSLADAALTRRRSEGEIASRWPRPQPMSLDREPPASAGIGRGRRDDCERSSQKPADATKLGSGVDTRIWK